MKKLKLTQSLWNETLPYVKFTGVTTFESIFYDASLKANQLWLLIGVGILDMCNVLRVNYYAM